MSRNDPELPDPLSRALSGLMRPVAILDVDPDCLVVPTARGLLEAPAACSGELVQGPFDRISAGLAAPGFDEPALRTFLGSNWLRTLEAVLP